MSRYEEAARLCRRALRYLEAAKDDLAKGFYDVSATNCGVPTAAPEVLDPVPWP